MAPPTVVRSAKAVVDAEDVFIWIARHDGASRARGVIFRLERTLERLAARSGLGRVRADFVGEPRSFSVPPWLVVYEPLAEDRGILVLRILDSRRDIAALMGKKS
jgi:toxin ParE1/3/4